MSEPETKYYNAIYIDSKPAFSCRAQQPVIFLPDESGKKKCKSSPKMSAFGYLAFVVSVINAVANAANNINNNQNNNNNNNNDNNNNNNNVNIANSNTNQNNQNMLMAGRELGAPSEISADGERVRLELAKHYNMVMSKRDTSTKYVQQAKFPIESPCEYSVQNFQSDGGSHRSHLKLS